MTTIAIAGATGAVGQQMLECLKERNIQETLKNKLKQKKEILQLEDCSKMMNVVFQRLMK